MCVYMMRLLEEERMSLEEEIDFLNHLANTLLLSIRIIRSSLEGRERDVGPLTLESLKEFLSNLKDVLRKCTITNAYYSDPGRYLAKIMEEISKKRGKTLNEINDEWYYLIVETLSILEETKINRKEMQNLKERLEEKLLDIEKLYSEKRSRLSL
ncbi:MAG: hypothetical protein QXT67_09075 [Candidatus Bathyarchaeia archaeon]